MLNISPQRINDPIDPRQFTSLSRVENQNSGRAIARLILLLFGLIVLVMFLPWTQNIRARGKVTTLRPDQRPQTIHSVIAGQIEKWFINEGDYVKKGDTIIYLSEIRDNYFDPDLLSRTQAQWVAKEQSARSYQAKVRALEDRIEALNQAGTLKLEQARNKVQQARLKVMSDSINNEAAQVNYKIAKTQYERLEALYQNGLKSLTDLESRRLVLQKAEADRVSKANKLLASKNEQINAEVEVISIAAQYKDKITKAESEKYAALSGMYDAEAMAAKLNNQYMNYTVRSGLYYIRAPQDGYITKAIQSGIGEIIKEGEEVVSIMPARYELAVEMYINPIDLPLLEKGQKVRIQFDGWPAIVFSGWPNTSYGTYGGKIFAIDNFISESGKYRILVSPDHEDHAWPDALRIGAGTRSMVLLKDVSVGYELWRKINGFPPDYYKRNTAINTEK